VQVRRFLARASILSRLCGPLCDAVTGDNDGDAVPAELRRLNLFIIPLDRCHQLFADRLGNLLRREWSPAQKRDLHVRASDRCEQNGLTSDAVSHALEGEDFEGAADWSKSWGSGGRRERLDGRAAAM
jgi:LuxR family maltose regulon positive regulatory protein